jgi:hypothetical protein
MTHQELRPLFEDPSASPELRNFVALARGDGPSQAELDHLATRVGRAIGVSAGVLLAGSASATALGTPPVELASALKPALTGKLGVLAKLFATGGGKLLAVGLSAGMGVGVWAYMRQPAPAVHAPIAQAPAPVAEPRPEPEAERASVASTAPAQRAAAAPALREEPAALQEEPAAPVPVVTALQRAPRARAARAAGRPGRRAAASAAAAPVQQEASSVADVARPTATADNPSELSLIQQAEAARQRGVEALKLLATHERLYPRGALAQEREVLAIELLLKLGKRQQAHERAARFTRDYPSSAHQPRVRALVERAGDE